MIELTQTGSSPWVQSTLGESFKWSSGGTPNSATAEYYDGDIPWAVIADLNNGLVNATRKTITEQGLRASSAKWVDEDSLLFAMYGSIGKLGITGTRMTTNQAIAFTKPTCCSTKFLFYYLLWARPRIFELKVGATQSNVSQSIIKTIPFFYPRERAEQDRIVNRIETQLSRLDAAIENLLHAQSNLKRYRASILKAACQGRLIRIEPVPRNFADTEILGAKPVPAGWPQHSIGELLTEKPKNGVSVKGSGNPPGIRALRLNAMGESGFDYDKVRFLPLEPEQVEDIFIREGDFFVSRGNGSLHLVGRGSLAGPPPEPTIFPDTMIRLRVNDAIVSSRWLNTIWPSRTVRSQIEKMVKTTAGIYKISQPQLLQILIPIPSLQDQEIIATEVERHSGFACRLEDTIRLNLLRAKRLRDAILEKHFNKSFETVGP